MGGLSRAVYSATKKPMDIPLERDIPFGIQNRQQRRKLNSITKKALAHARKIGAID